MKTIIGMDAHSSFCRLAMYTGNYSFIKSVSVLTGQEKLINFFSSVPKPCTVIFEESDLSSWLRRSLSPFVNKIVVSNPKENAWISKTDIKDDGIDGHKLVKLHRAQLLKEVYHSQTEEKIFYKELILHYHDITRQVTRTKNKIKAEFRQKLIRCTGDSVYASRERDKWLKKLPHSIAILQVNNYWKMLDELQKIKVSILTKLSQEGKKYPEIKRFCDIPGVALITATTIFAIIDTPYRFSKKSKLWAYANLGKGQHQSAFVNRSKPVQNGNRLLKGVLLQAVQNALKNKNKFSRKYYELVYRGLSPKRARRIIARNILTTAWSIWKSGERYVE